MVNIQRLRVALTGFIGGPGVSTFYGLDAGALMTPVHDFYGRLLAKFPYTVTFTVEPQGDIIDPLTGDLTGSWSHAPVTSIGGSATGAYSAATGAAVSWLTGSVFDKHRLKGRTFLVPLIGNAFGADGSIDDTSLATIRASAVTLVADGVDNFVVWHRPLPGGARAGGYSVVNGSFVNDKAAVLRSRRD